MNTIYTYIAGILFLSCTSSEPAGKGSNGGLPGMFQSITSEQPSNAVPEALNPEAYAAWVHEQTGITFNSVSNDQFLISLTFNPPPLEAYSAAVTNGENPAKTLTKYLDIQKGFYYCTAACIIKSESASNPVKKTELLAGLKEGLVVVKNNRDTLSNSITEAFPSYVMNQPNKLLILIPNTDSVSSYQISIHGSRFNLPDCSLNLSSKTIQSFPLIKL